MLTAGRPFFLEVRMCLCKHLRCDQLGRAYSPFFSPASASSLGSPSTEGRVWVWPS